MIYQATPRGVELLFVNQGLAFLEFPLMLPDSEPEFPTRRAGDEMQQPWFFLYLPKIFKNESSQLTNASGFTCGGCAREGLKWG